MTLKTLGYTSVVTLPYKSYTAEVLSLSAWFSIVDLVNDIGLHLLTGSLRSSISQHVLFREHDRFCERRFSASGRHLCNSLMT